MNASAKAYVDGADLHPAVADAIADELVGLTAALSDLAFELGSDPATVRRHMGGLQAIDLITQTHLALADLLRSDEPMSVRIAQIPIEGLAGRLRLRVIDGQTVDRGARQNSDFEIL